MMIKIECPKCETEGSMSMLEANYQGPYRCWKCRGLFTITMENNEVTSWEPLSQEELDKQQEIEALRNKFKQ